MGKGSGTERDRRSARELKARSGIAEDMIG